MGAIHFSVDRAAVDLLARTLGLTTFVETGTFHGDSVAAVRTLFTALHSAEISADFVTAARARFHGDAAVTIHAGASPGMLRLLHATPQDRVFYWLDAHWCESGDTDAAGQCPLLEELAAIGTVGGHSVIAIDDARLFLAPPTEVHAIGDWPHFDDVLAGLHRAAPRHRILVLNDVIWAVPAEAFDPLLAYAVSHGADWLAMAEKSRTYDAVMSQLGDKDREIVALTAENQARLDLIGRLHATLDAAAKADSERAAVAESVRDHLQRDAADAAALAAGAAARCQELDAQVRSLQAVADERGRLIATLDAAARAAAERAGALEEEIRQLVARTQSLEATAAEVAGQAAAAAGRADSMEQAAAERLAVIERLDGIARATGQRADALDELVRMQAATLAEWQARAAAAEEQLAELTAAATAAIARAQEAERERDARQIVIDELVRARDAFAAALAAVPRPTGLGRLLFRSRT